MCAVAILQKSELLIFKEIMATAGGANIEAAIA
jgi:hypothetical protein